jgi:hypothetical protein
MSPTESRLRLPDEAAQLLWKSEGFAVVADGRAVGTVEDTVRIPGLARPAALAVRLDSPRKRVALVPVTDIRAIDVDSRTIVLVAPPNLQP